MHKGPRERAAERAAHPGMGGYGPAAGGGAPQPCGGCP